MSSQHPSVQRPQSIALCYVRLSQNKDGDDAVSPERQRANILAKCRERGYTPEWYEDVDGHKSGRDVKNRPGWQALSKRLGDPDVVALIGNDLARFHRKGWRVGDLVEFVDEHNIDLILAAPGREIDTSSAMGKVFIYLTAIFDEFYAEDISNRVKDSIAHRKNLGKTVGRPPFGTTRDKEGYLMPNNDEGGWWLVDGRFQAGQSDTPPADDALWRTYYESAKHALTLFADGDIGVEKLSYQLNEDGYPFRDRKGKPRKWNRDDVRRVIANWPEYGGIVLDQKAKDRSTHTRDEVDAMPLDSDRAVFPIEMLKRIGYARSARTMKIADNGRKRHVYPYPLSNITRCAQCERLVAAEDDIRLRSELGGATRKHGRVYRHRPGINCGCDTRSVPCETLEDAFGVIIKGLTVDQDAFDIMLQMAHETDRHTLDHAPGKPEDLMQMRERNIKKLKRKITNTKLLFREDELSEAEYRAHLTEYRAELAYWEAYKTEQEEVTLQLSLCLDAITRVSDVWDIAQPAERRTMAHNLFDYITYDLDKQQIVDFRLKAWANGFLVLRAALSNQVARGSKTPTQGGSSGVPHTGFSPQLRFYPDVAKTVLFHTFSEFSPSIQHQKAVSSRNQRIRQLYADGELMIDLSKMYGISCQRISQIVHG